MQFVEVNDVVCGDDFAKCPLGSTCVRPLSFDGPYFCLHKSLLGHIFHQPFICDEPLVDISTTTSTTFTPATTVTAAVSTASGSGAHIFVIFLLVSILSILSGIFFFQYQIYRKSTSPVILQQVSPQRVVVSREDEINLNA